MNPPVSYTLIKQHLIDPEICIRCNTCESICPKDAITHDVHNYVVDVEKCNWCRECASPCPTGAIEHYRTMPLIKAYTLEEQLSWDTLPLELSATQRVALLSQGAAEKANAEEQPSAGR